MYCDSGQAPHLTKQLRALVGLPPNSVSSLVLHTVQSSKSVASWSAQKQRVIWYEPQWDSTHSQHYLSFGRSLDSTLIFRHFLLLEVLICAYMWVGGSVHGPGLRELKATAAPFSLNRCESKPEDCFELDGGRNMEEPWCLMADVVAYVRLDGASTATFLSATGLLKNQTAHKRSPPCLYLGLRYIRCTDYVHVMLKQLRAFSEQRSCKLATTKGDGKFQSLSVAKALDSKTYL